MTQIERNLYFRACQPAQHLGDAFGDHKYEDDADEENAADVGDDDDDEVDRMPS